MTGKSEDLIPVKIYKSSGLGQFGYVNKNNDWIVKDSYVFTNPRNKDFYPVETMWFKKGLLNLSGELVVEMKYKQLKGLGDPFIQVRLDDKWGLIDKKGTEIIPCEYDFICNFDTEEQGIL